MAVKRTGWVVVRIRPHNRAIIKRAASSAGVTLSEFVRVNLMHAARKQLAAATSPTPQVGA